MLYRTVRFIQGMFTDKDTKMKKKSDVTIENMLYSQLELKPIPVPGSV